jgi:hypothetical protein
MTALDDARQRFRKKFEDAGIRAEKFLALARPAVIFRPAPAIFEGDIAPGASKIGGHPDLPAGYDWPEDLRVQGSELSFLVQINLAEAPVLDIALPGEGLLSVFGHPEEFDIGRLVWSPPGALVRHEPPGGSRTYPARRLESAVEMTLDTQRRDFPKLGDDERPYRVLEDREDDQIVQLGGDPFVIQYPMDETCDQIAGDTERLADDEARWVHILQIGSIEAAEMAWGDGGSLYVWLRAGDLAARRFGNAVVTVQCY